MLRLTWKRDRWSRSFRRWVLHRRRQEDGGESGLLHEASGQGGRGRIRVRRRLWPGRRDGARAHSRRSGNAIKHLESLEIGSLINCADEAIDAAAETFWSGRISALKEMETSGKLMI